MSILGMTTDENVLLKSMTFLCDIPMVPCEEFFLCQKGGKSDVYYQMSKAANWHGHESTEVKDVDSDMARQHGRQKLQVATQALKVKGSNKRSTIF